MALPKNVIDMLVGPVLSDRKRASLGFQEVARITALTRYGPACIGCGDQSSDHMRFYAATTLENVSAPYLMSVGLPYNVRDRFNRFSPIVVMCPACARKARKDRLQHPEEVPERYRYTLDDIRR